MPRPIHDLGSWLGRPGSATAAIPSNDDGWRALTRAALDARVAGLLLDSARARGIIVPEPARRSLQTQAVAIAAQSAMFTRELQPVLHALHAADIPVMLLKGAALSLARGVAEGEAGVRAYDRPDLRAMTDVDLLVPPADARRAVAVLEGAGCRRGASLLRDDFFPRFYYETELFSPGRDPARIDLHARPLRPLRTAVTVPDDALWDGAIEVTVGSARAFVPGREAMLVHLCAHAAFHGCSRLVWLVDIARLAQRHAEVIRWDLVIALRRWRLVAAVGQGLAAAARLPGPVCPASVLEELWPDGGSWCERLVLRTAPRDAASPLGHLLVSLLTTPGLRLRLGYLLAVLLPGRAHLAELYPHRHAGWLACALGVRAVRALRRAIPV